MNSMVKGYFNTDELQNLAETYNQVYKENKEAQKLIRHEAEYDNLKRAFRTIDYVCRIGGDEFAIIMAEMVTVFINKLTEICYTKVIEIANEDGVFALALVGGRKEAALWRTIFL